MGESLVHVTELKTHSVDSKLDPSNGSSSSLFQRRIEFHPARKPFKGFSNGGGDFHIETLNPSSSDSTRAGFTQGQSVKGGKRVDGSEILENGVDPELSFGITFRRIVSFFSSLIAFCSVLYGVSCF